jgi:hypothetical protein
MNTKIEALTVERKFKDARFWQFTYMFLLITKYPDILSSAVSRDSTMQARETNVQILMLRGSRS